jgi:hypothetical protein
MKTSLAVEAKGRHVLAWEQRQAGVGFPQNGFADLFLGRLEVHSRSAGGVVDYMNIMADTRR